jgi:hypothetical protein
MSGLESAYILALEEEINRLKEENDKFKNEFMIYPEDGGSVIRICEMDDEKNTIIIDHKGPKCSKTVVYAQQGHLTSAIWNSLKHNLGIEGETQIIIINCGLKNSDARLTINTVNNECHIESLKSYPITKRKISYDDVLRLLRIVKLI